MNGRTGSRLVSLVPPAKRPAPRRIARPGLEALEDRLALSTIIWENRGGGANGDSDGFEQYYGGSAGRARAIVDAAIDAWESAIYDFRYLYDPTKFPNAYEPGAGAGNQPNTYRLSISATDFSDPELWGEEVSDSRLGGTAQSSADHSGKPFAAYIYLDNDAGKAPVGKQWYFDATPYGHTEITSLFDSYSGSGALNDRQDFYSVILHEIGHAVGISYNADLAIHQHLNDSGLDSPNDDPSRRSDLYTFDTNPTDSVPPLATLMLGGSNPGHLYAGPAQGGLPLAPNDLMNPFNNRNERKVVSALDLTLLYQAYDYAVSDYGTPLGPNYAHPLTLAQMSSPVHADATNGVIVINGDFSSRGYDDLVAIKRNGDLLQVQLNDQFYTYSREAFTSGTILVRGGRGKDTIEIDLANGDLLPVVSFVRVEGGGDPFDAAQGDQLILKTGAQRDAWIEGDAVSVGSNLVVQHHDMEGLQVQSSAADDNIRIHGTHYTLDHLYVHTGAGADEVALYAAAEGTRVTIHGGTENDKITVGNAEPGLANLLGPVAIHGDEGGSDALHVLAHAETDQTITLNLDSVKVGGKTVSFADIEDLTVEGGSTSDTFKLLAVPSEASVTFDGGNGSDHLVALNQINTWDIFAADEGALNSTVHFVGVENLTGGNKVDTFDLGAGGSITGVMDGKNGANELTYDGLPSTVAVTVDLEARTATRTGGFRNLATFTGGGGRDTLKGAVRSGTTWALTGANAGQQTWSYTLGSVTISGAFGFTSFEHLVGTSLDETFAFRGGSLDGTITGGGGIDTLDYSRWRAGVTVNLTLGTASAVSAGISGIRNATGGSGSDVLMGNDLVNVLLGGSGADVLVGASGADTLRGGGGGDILIGGNVRFGRNLADALESIRATWAHASLTFDQKVKSLTGPPTEANPYQLSNSTVIDDTDADTLEGGAGRDLFFAALASELLDKEDQDRWYAY